MALNAKGCRGKKEKKRGKRKFSVLSKDILRVQSEHVYSTY
jgi:hypothetical protein